VTSFLVALLVGAGTARATEISGTISSTLTIFQDSELVGDVTCTVTGGPCIAFGAPDLTLELNGFTITGRADALTPCSTSGPGEIGIDVNNQQHEVIRGPGLVRQFRNLGIRLFHSTGVVVKNVTLSSNCFSGIIVTAGSDNELEANVSVRNGSPVAPCGGIWLNGTSHNRLRENRLSGNGYASQGSNFGIGLVAPGTNDNVIEDNTLVGNTNGIILVPGVEGNVIRHNIVAGNPPVQISVTFPAADGVDIRNQATPGTNTIDDNFCLTSVNAPCPVVGRRGDHDERKRDDDSPRRPK
jgi:parallel beta-helix repeat protein